MALDLHPEAVGDLDEILEYFNSFNPTSAVRLLDSFFAKFDSLAKMPHQGFRRPDLTSRPLRFAIVENYLIAYAPDRDPIWVVAVIDGRRNPRVVAAILRNRD